VEGLAGLGFLIFIVWVILVLVFFLMVLSIAIDCARLLRRTNRIIELLEKKS